MIQTAGMDPGLLGSLILAAVGVLIFAGLFATRGKGKRHVAHRHERPLAPLVFRGHEERAEELRRTTPSSSAWLGDSGVPPATRPPVARPAATRPAAEPIIAGGTGMVEGGMVRFSPVAEGTLQLLPGRLEIIEGEDRGHDVRFVRTRAGMPEITFGRSEGSPHQHVQLLSRTVSREHARMRFDGQRWSITNLSQTNPVVVNGEELPAVEGTQFLSEGDRIEMGEVVFLFHER